MIDFEEATHTYRHRGAVVPSVTQILKDMGIIDTAFLTDEAATRGTHIHQALQFFDEGTLDIDSLDPAYVGYVQAWEEVCHALALKFEAIERVGYDASYRYAGTIDRVAIMDRFPCVLDIKTGPPKKWHALQLAAYQRLADPTLLRTMYRYGIYLNDDGTYRVCQYSNPADMRAWIALATAWHAKQEYTE